MNKSDQHEITNEKDNNVASLRGSVEIKNGYFENNFQDQNISRTDGMTQHRKHFFKN